MEGGERERGEAPPSSKKTRIEREREKVGEAVGRLVAVPSDAEPYH